MHRRRPTAAIRTPRLRRWALASLIANIGIVLTGGAVRLTASGLGCPTWPRCTEDSFVPTGESGMHEAIEFGNRLMTFVLVIIAVGTLVAAWQHRPADRRLRRPALLLALGIPAQAVVGGVTVLTGLNPWVVTWHFLVSMILVATAVVLVRRTEARERAPVHPVLRRLSMVVAVAAGLVVWLGTVVTATGPHAGDATARRTGLSLQLVAQAHADAVFLLLGLTVATVVAARVLRRAPSDSAPAPGNGAVGRAAMVLLAVEVAQGVIGYSQWFSGLPPWLVGAHMLGASLVVAAATDLVVAARPERGVAPPQTPVAPSAARQVTS